MLADAQSLDIYLTITHSIYTVQELIVNARVNLDSVAQLVRALHRIIGLQVRFLREGLRCSCTFANCSRLDLKIV